MKKFICVMLSALSRVSHLSLWRYYLIQSKKKPHVLTPLLCGIRAFSACQGSEKDFMLRDI
jgi:hypothetical protein